MLIKLFSVNSYYLLLMGKFTSNNYYLPLINLKNIMENYYWLMKIFTINECD